jgi:uncharacterized protein YggE
MKTRSWKQYIVIGVTAALAAGLAGLQAGYAQTATPTPARITVTSNQTTATPDQITPPAGTPVPGTGAGSTRWVSVTGVGEVSVVPDEAQVTLGVQTDADTASEALSQNNDQMQALLDALAGEGVARADMRTQFVSLFPRYAEQPQAGQPEVAGYTAIHNVEIHVRDLDQLGTLLDAAVAAGGNTISGIRFTASDNADADQQARAAAMDDARAKAEQLAALAGAALGPVISISEGSTGPTPVFGGDIVADIGGAVPIEPGTETQTVSLQVTWQLTN